MRAHRLLKIPYYARSAITLTVALRPESWLPMLFRRGQDTLVLRSGLRFEVPELLDLLVIKETICDDAYRLAELTGIVQGLIVDVGAGIGDFTVLAASKFPRASVLACEPNPQTFKVLERNIQRNRLSNVDARCIAVGTRETYILSRGRWSAEASARHVGGPTIPVPAVRLDELIGDRDVDLLKIDCEGGELDVLESLDRRIDHVKRVVVEYHGHLADAAGARVEQLLRAQGLVVRRKPDRYDRRIGYVYAAVPPDRSDAQEV